MIINCDKCHKDYKIDVKTTNLDDNIQEVCHICPHCNTKYIAYYTDILIRKKQSKMRRYTDKRIAAINKNDTKQANNFVKKMNKLRKELERDMKTLRKKVEDGAKEDKKYVHR